MAGVDVDRLHRNWLELRLGVREDLLEAAAARLPAGDVLRDAIGLELESAGLYADSVDAVRRFERRAA